MTPEEADSGLHGISPLLLPSPWSSEQNAGRVAGGQAQSILSPGMTAQPPPHDNLSAKLPS